MQNFVLLYLPQDQTWWHFQDPVRVVTAQEPQAVLPALQVVEQATQEGHYAAGFVSYEAASAFDSALQTHLIGDFPLVWFGLYAAPQTLSSKELLVLLGQDSYQMATWVANVDISEFNQTINDIKRAIAAGETYQVNYTFRLRSQFQGSARSLFLDLLQAQPGAYAALIDLGRYAICSVSPELFLKRVGSQIITKPMKGTAPRGKTWEQDQQHLQSLRSSLKDRAENLMIVDMLRNDLGRIATTGTVQVPQLFEIERYRTLLQMTSTVTAETQVSIVDLFQSLFPCASITGAPKVRTMQLIRELEPEPRRIYTGAIGYCSPHQEAQFNVAIRTVLIDRARGIAEYGVGSGIVWDSDSQQEYAECLVKTQILTRFYPDFSLLETIRWTPWEGYFLLSYHFQRLQNSAQYFEIPLDLAELQMELDRLSASLSEPSKVRIILHPDRSWIIETSLLQPLSLKTPLRVRLAPSAVDSTDCFLYHKTTYRRVYDEARQACPDCDDVLLWNFDQEVTESCVANLLVQHGSDWITPPIHCGLLPGTYRAWLLEQNKAQEAVITLDMLRQYQTFYLINSVMGCRPAILVQG